LCGASPKTYDTAPPLERLLIDQILTVRLRLIHAEHKYTQWVMDQSITFKHGEYWDNLLSSTQARYLRAIVTHAKVRRLARNTPDLHINIASAGGKQVNLQREVNGQKDKLCNAQSNGGACEDNLAIPLEPTRASANGQRVAGDNPKLEARKKRSFTRSKLPSNQLPPSAMYAVHDH
jgi:hypothetical protein